MDKNPHVVVLCSGGLDSVTAAHLMKKNSPSSEITLLFFNYGQRACDQERMCMRMCAKNLGAEVVELALPELGKLSHSLLNKYRVKMQISRSLSDTSGEHTQWYVPFRNTVFLSYAFAYVESVAVIGKKKDFLIVTGFKCEGKEPYPDTTERYVKKMNALAKVAAPFLNIQVYAPLIKKDKEDIILLGNKLGVDFTKTVSCYVGGKKQCGACLACRLRKAGFRWAGAKDPTSYT